MAIRCTLDGRLAGVTLSAALDGELIQVSTNAYLSSEDGNEFVTHVEAVWSCFSASMLQAGIHASQIDHFIALIGPDNNATLYCNELQQRLLVRAKNPIQAGQSVFCDDIANIEEMRLFSVDGSEMVVPPDYALVVILSVGWRKCLYYDFEPLIAGAPPRSLNVAQLLGRLQQQLLFQSVYSITNEQWASMFSWGWFPFIWMTKEDRNKILHFSNRPDEPKSLFEEVCRNFEAVLPERAKSWQRLAFFQDHAVFVETAIKHYQSGDYLSAIQVLYPRIEGILRQHHLLNRPGANPHQKAMVEALVANQHDYSLLLPERFREYLTSFYFRAFDEKTGDLTLSRNSVAHCVSLSCDYNLIKASLGFMICDQMFYFLAPTRKSQP